MDKFENIKIGDKVVIFLNPWEQTEKVAVVTSVTRKRFIADGRVYHKKNGLSTYHGLHGCVKKLFGE